MNDFILTEFRKKFTIGLNSHLNFIPHSLVIHCIIDELIWNYLFKKFHLIYFSIHFIFWFNSYFQMFGLCLSSYYFTHYNYDQYFDFELFICL